MDVRWRGSRAVRKYGVRVVRLSRDLAVSVFGLVRSGVSADVRHDNVYATCCLHLSARFALNVLRRAHPGQQGRQRRTPATPGKHVAEKSRSPTQMCSLQVCCLFARLVVVRDGTPWCIARGV